MDNLDVWPLSVEKEELRSAFDVLFHRKVVAIFLKTCVEDHGDTPALADCKKEGLD